MEKDKITVCNLYATVTSGLEKLSKLEFQEKFSSILTSIEVSPGKIIFSIQDAQSIVSILNKLLVELKSVEHLFLILFSFELEEDQMKLIKESVEEKIKITNSFLFQKACTNFLINSKNLLDFLQIYKELRSINTDLIKFRIDIKENVVPRPEKNDLAKLLAEFLESNYSSSLDPDITEYLMKFSLEKIEKNYYFSIKLTMNQPLGLAQVSALREKTPATMRPSIAYNLCRLLKIAEGDIIIDPMCGSSTIIEIALKEFKNQAYYICADIDELSLQKSQRNLGNLGFVDIILCDSRRSPFRPSVFDKIITDMPFGKRCGSHKENVKIYPFLTQEFKRIMVEGGKAVVVTTEKSLIFNNFKKKNGWRRDDFFMINKGGLDVFVTVCKKKTLVRKRKKIAEEKNAESKEISEEKKTESKEISEEKKTESKEISEEKKFESKEIYEEKKFELKENAEEKKFELKEIAEEKKVDLKEIVLEKKDESKEIS